MANSTATPLRAQDSLWALAQSLRLDRRRAPPALLLAACMHVGLAVVLPRFSHGAVRPRERPLEIIDVEPPRVPPPVPTEPPPEPSRPETPPPRALRTPTTAAQPPVAQSARVLTRDDRRDEPVDLTGGFVVGDGAAYAGGTTAATGTPTRVVHEASVANAPAASDPQRTAPSEGPDLSRRPSMAGGSSWRCPFPPEADGVDEASVQLRVDVDAAGHVVKADVVRDPGHGFGREAHRCVLDKQWTPARDRSGEVIGGTTVVMVRFVR